MDKAVKVAGRKSVGKFSLMLIRRVLLFLKQPIELQISTWKNLNDI